MPIFYFRKMRKIGLFEGLVYIFIISTLCQYCVNWAAYWEKQFTLSEAVNTEMKKIQKRASKAKKGSQLDEKELEKEMEEEKESILGPKPTCYDTLPFQSFRLTKYVVFAIPSLPQTIYGVYKAEQEKKLAKVREEKEEEEEQKRREEEKEKRKEQKKQRKRVDRYQDRTGEVIDSESDSTTVTQKASVFKQPANALQVWTDADLAKLARMMKKYPSGTPDRWDRIAEVMERLPWEVTKMAMKVKEVSYQVSEE